MMALRNRFDVGHISIALQRARDLEQVYRYLAESQRRFRQLLVHAIDAAAEGSWVVEEPPDLALNPEQRKQMNRLVETIGPRNPAPWGGKTPSAQC